MNSRQVQIAAGLFGFTGVALGAIGTHGLRDVLLERGMTNAWETAARYHLLHSIALLAVGVALSQSDSNAKWLGWAARGWMAGVLLFSGSLYALALGGPRWLGPVTPLGGVCLLFGWFAVGVAGLRKRV